MFMNRRLILAMLMGAPLFTTTTSVDAQTPDLSFPLPTWSNPPTESVSGVEHGTFQSAAVGQAVGYNILLPPAYASDLRKYPVVYFLHGLNGNENSATRLIAPILLGVAQELFRHSSWPDRVVPLWKHPCFLNG